MSLVMINCPETGQAVQTRYTMSEAQFDAMEDGRFSFRCVVCNQIHAWHKADAWVQPYRKVDIAEILGA